MTGEGANPGPDTPDEKLAQDPGIPGRDVISEDHSPPPDEKDLGADRRERLDDPDQEGHQTAVETPLEP